MRKRPVSVLLLCVALLVFAMPFSARADSSLAISACAGKNVQEELLSAVSAGHSYKAVLSSGSLPDGLSLKTLEVSGKDRLILFGVPSEGGTYRFTVDWLDITAGKAAGRCSVTMNIRGELKVKITASRTSLKTGDKVTLTAKVSGGSGEYRYQWKANDASAGSSPSITWPSSSGVTLSDDGTVFTCTVTDSVNGSTATSGSLTLSVTCSSHSYGDWKESRPATCTEPQQLSRTCRDCGHTETKEGAPAAEHTFGEWTAAEEGFMSRFCTVCGAEETATAEVGEPVILQQPESISVTAGEDRKISVVVDSNGIGTITYEWQFSAVPDFGRTGAAGTSSRCAATREGYYRVLVTQTAAGISRTVTSAPVFVHIHEFGPWEIHYDEGTAHRTCLADGCGETQSLPLTRLLEEHPSDARDCGLTRLRLNGFAALKPAAVAASSLVAAAGILGLLRTRKRKNVR